MMSFCRFNLFWIAVCLAAVLPVQTNTLLAVHLSACCDCHDDPAERSEAPSHDQEHCSLCQMLLTSDGKVIAGDAVACTLPEPPRTQPPAAFQWSIPKSTVSCTVCRGPPCA